MSRSNPTATNPAKRFLQWKGGEEGGGQLTYWDKEAEEEKVVKLPFVFLVLDELNTMTGWSEADRSSFWANEVRNMANDELTVRTKSGIKARGLYAQISDGLKAKGAKYAKSVYIAFKDESGELVIGNLRLSGAALTAWIDFNKKFNVYKCAVALEGSSGPHKKGSTKYFTPVFDGRNVQPATDQAAKQLDDELQGYLSAMERRPQPDIAEVVDDGPDEEVEITDLPETEEAAPAEKKAAKTETVEAAESDDVDLKDVPF